MFTLKTARVLLASSGLAILAACGGGGSDPAPTPPPATTYTIGGTVAGLAGSGLVLQLNGGGNLPVAASGAFTFTAPVTSGAAYAVTVSTQPSSPTQTCTVANGSGTASANVTNVTVTCSTASFTVGGTITGLAGTGLVLRNNGQNATITGSSFVFPAQASGSAYAVTVQTQPSAPPQTCVVASGSGTVAANVTNVTVTCTTNPPNQFVVSGTITGYTGTGLVLRRTIGAATTDHPASAGATGFAFAAQNDLTTYAITVLTQPSSPTQNCIVTNGTGTLAGSNVSNVVVACTTNLFTVGGTVSGLIGTGLVLRNNGGDNKTIAANGPYTFATGIASGSAYAVTVLTQPTAPAQTCTVAGGTGTIAANVTNANITCVSNELIPPTVTTGSRVPQDTTVGTDLFTNIVVDFSEALMPSSVTTGSVTVTGPAGAVAGAVTLSPATRITFDPTAALAFNTTYTVTLTNAIQDVSGNALAQHVWTFNTGRKVVAGGYHTCARLAGTDNGKLKCWGSNSFGQLGRENGTPVGVTAGQMGSALTAVNLGSGRTAVDIALGENFTCARLDNGSVKCWGLNDEGQLGLGHQFNLGDSSGDMTTLPTLTFVGTSPVQELVAGARHACARMTDGSVQCWGSNESGIIGQDTNNARYLTPQVVPLGAGLKAVGLAASGSYHTCARLVNASNAYAGVKCWGDNAFGQLGQGDTAPRGDLAHPMNGLTAITLGTALPVIQVVATSGHSCALLSDNTVKCWGNNWFGQLGTQTTNPGSACTPSTDHCFGDEPLEMAGLPSVLLGGSVTELSGGDRQTCARLGATVKCWGWGDYGQLGKGNHNTLGDNAGEMGSSLTAIDLGTFNATQISAGGFHECAVSDAGVVKCWGYNATQLPQPAVGQGGQLGLGDTNNRGDDPNEMGAALLAVDLTP